MRCLYCNKRLGWFASKKRPFCSDLHENWYVDEQAGLTMRRVMDPFSLASNPAPAKFDTTLIHDAPAPAPVGESSPMLDMPDVPAELCLFLEQLKPLPAPGELLVRQSALDSEFAADVKAPPLTGSLGFPLRVGPGLPSPGRLPQLAEDSVRLQAPHPIQFPAAEILSGLEMPAALFPTRASEHRAELVAASLLWELPGSPQFRAPGPASGTAREEGVTLETQLPSRPPVTLHVELGPGSLLTEPSLSARTSPGSPATGKITYVGPLPVPRIPANPVRAATFELPACPSVPLPADAVHTVLLPAEPFFPAAESISALGTRLSPQLPVDPSPPQEIAFTAPSSVPDAAGPVRLPPPIPFGRVRRALASLTRIGRQSPPQLPVDPPRKPNVALISRSFVPEAPAPVPPKYALEAPPEGWGATAAASLVSIVPAPDSSHPLSPFSPGYARLDWAKPGRFHDEHFSRLDPQHHSARMAMPQAGPPQMGAAKKPADARVAAVLPAPQSLPVCTTVASSPARALNVEPAITITLLAGSAKLPAASPVFAVALSSSPKPWVAGTAGWSFVAPGLRLPDAAESRPNLSLAGIGAGWRGATRSELAACITVSICEAFPATLSPAVPAPRVSPGFISKIAGATFVPGRMSPAVSRSLPVREDFRPWSTAVRFGDLQSCSAFTGVPASAIRTAGLVPLHIRGAQPVFFPLQEGFRQSSAALQFTDLLSPGVESAAPARNIQTAGFAPSGRKPAVCGFVPIREGFRLSGTPVRFHDWTSHQMARKASARAIRPHGFIRVRVQPQACPTFGFAQERSRQPDRSLFENLAGPPGAFTFTWQVPRAGFVSPRLGPSDAICDWVFESRETSPAVCRPMFESTTAPRLQATVYETGFDALPAGRAAISAVPPRLWIPELRGPLHAPLDNETSYCGRLHTSVAAGKLPIARLPLASRFEPQLEKPLQARGSFAAPPLPGPVRLAPQAPRARATPIRRKHGEERFRVSASPVQRFRAVSHVRFLPPLLQQPAFGRLPWTGLHSVWHSQAIHERFCVPGLAVPARPAAQSPFLNGWTQFICPAESLSRLPEVGT